MDWIDKIADVIESDPGEPTVTGDFTPGFIRRVTLEHVPRCETCAHWMKVDAKTGDCKRIIPGSVTLDLASDFGCVRWKEK